MYVLERPRHYQTRRTQLNMISRIRNTPYWLFLIAAYSVAVLGCLWLTGCVSPSGLEAAVESAVADGQVTPAEVEQIQAQLPKSFDWMQAVTIGGSILGSILGIKYLPSRALQGPWDPKQPPVSPS
jgi:hypothetical protein